MEDAGSMDVTPPECVPSEAEWDSTVRDLVMNRCGTCHGEEPDFGAPFSLLDYGAITAGADGSRIVDDMHRELANMSMPPRSAPQPTLDERNVIAGWASCGEVVIDGPMVATRPPFVAPTEEPEGLEVIDITASDVEVAASVRDRYDDFDFTNLTDEEVFIRRFDAIVDESRVVHHLTLRRGDPDEELAMKYLYAWAPGTGAIEFPDGGGVRLKPGDNLRLQIHYNNGAAIEGVRDSSGVRLWVGPPEGDEYYMIDPGPGAVGFSIPARDTATISNTCEFRSPVRAIASMPHMHEIGQAFDLRHTPVGGEETSILALSTWDFETQLFYELPVEFAAGDRLTVECDFENMSGDIVRAGARTQDEMCYAFTYVTPPPEDGLYLCVPAGTGEATELMYEPGACLSAEPATTDEVRGVPTLNTEGPVFDEDGAIADGHYVVSDLILSTPSPGVISVARVTAAGQVTMNGGEITWDGALHIIAPIDGLQEGFQSDFSFTGDVVSSTGPTDIAMSCPVEGGDQPFVFGTVDGRPAVRLIPDDFGVEIEFWFLLQ